MNPLFESYKIAFDISPVPMLLVSQRGEIVLGNDELDNLFGYEREELTGKSVETLIPDSVREHHPQLRNAYFRVPTKRGMAAGRDLHGKTKSGDVIPLELALEPVSIGDEVWAIVAVVDISHRKAMENRLRLAMDASATSMVMVNSEGQIVLVNNAAVTMFGYDESELLGSAVERLVPKNIRRVHPVFRNSFMNSSVARPMGPNQSLFAVHKDGSEIPVEIALTPVNTGEGQMVMSTIIDLSERLAAERSMASKAKELEELNVELSHFAYSASHDLKSPLVTIAGLLNACIEDLDDGNIDELRTNLTKTVKISQRSAAKVEGVLRVARAGYDKITTENIDLNELIANIWEDHLGELDGDIELTVQLDHDVPLHTERATLQVILENLISNSVRYRDLSKEKSTVCITSKSENSLLHVCVADNGVGISEKYRHLVFNMFKRIHERGGDGLGLALLKKQVERLEGHVDFTSKEGQGTEFSFTIPHAKCSQ